MDSFLGTAVIIACFTVLAIVAVGVTVFARGGAANRKYGNKIMQLRVGAQLVAVILIMALAWATSGG
jgi:hypothetical protein